MRSRSACPEAGRRLGHCERRCRQQPSHRELFHKTSLLLSPPSARRRILLVIDRLLCRMTFVTCVLLCAGLVYARRLPAAAAPEFR